MLICFNATYGHVSPNFQYFEYLIKFSGVQLGGYVDSYIFVFAFTAGLGVLGIIYSTFVLKECF